VSSAVATLPDSPIATGVATSAVRGWNGMVGGADGSGGRNWRTVETRSMLSAFDTTFRTPTFWASRPAKSNASCASAWEFRVGVWKSPGPGPVRP
jgi:hypothetical protein